MPQFQSRESIAHHTRRVRICTVFCIVLFAFGLRTVPMSSAVEVMLLFLVCFVATQGLSWGICKTTPDEPTGRGGRRGRWPWLMLPFWSILGAHTASMKFATDIPTATRKKDDTDHHLPLPAIVTDETPEAHQRRVIYGIIAASLFFVLGVLFSSPNVLGFALLAIGGAMVGDGVSWACCTVAYGETTARGVPAARWPWMILVSRFVLLQLAKLVTSPPASSIEQQQSKGDGSEKGSTKVAGDITLSTPTTRDVYPIGDLIALLETNEQRDVLCGAAQLVVHCSSNHKQESLVYKKKEAKPNGSGGLLVLANRSSNGRTCHTSNHHTEDNEDENHDCRKKSDEATTPSLRIEGTVETVCRPRGCSWQKTSPASIASAFSTVKPSVSATPPHFNGTSDDVVWQLLTHIRSDLPVPYRVTYDEKQVTMKVVREVRAMQLLTNADHPHRSGTVVDSSHHLYATSSLQEASVLVEIRRLRRQHHD